MKAVFAFIIAALVLALSPRTSAQEDPHLFTIQIWKTIIPEDGTMAERDSIAELAFNITVKNNPKVISERQMVHFYTEDSQEWIVVTEYANWNDINQAGTYMTEAIRKAYPDEAKRREFNRTFFRYFRQHSDKILSDKPKLRK